MCPACNSFHIPDHKFSVISFLELLINVFHLYINIYFVCVCILYVHDYVLYVKAGLTSFVDLDIKLLLVCIYLLLRSAVGYHL